LRRHAAMAPEGAVVRLLDRSPLRAHVRNGHIRGAPGGSAGLRAQSTGRRSNPGGSPRHQHRRAACRTARVPASVSRSTLAQLARADCRGYPNLDALPAAAVCAETQSTARSDEFVASMGMGSSRGTGDDW
jgi:hypothetical protein